MYSFAAVGYHPAAIFGSAPQLSMTAAVALPPRTGARPELHDFYKCLQELRQHIPLVNLQRLLLVAAHQINIELRDTDVGQLLQLLSVRLRRADQAETINHFVRDEIGVVAANLAVMLVIIAAAILHKRRERGRKFFRLVLTDEIHYVV